MTTIEKYENVNCDFADAVYNKAMSEKNGVEFCCEADAIARIRDKILMDEGAKQDDIDLCNINNELQ